MGLIAPLLDWSYTVLIGALVTSYWRGTWVLLDVWFCDQPRTASLTGGDSFCYLVPAMEDFPDGYYWNLRLKSARQTYGLGLGLLFVGVTMLWSGVWVPLMDRASPSPEGRMNMHLHPERCDAPEYKRVGKKRAALRFVIVYVMGFSAVCLWRGIWYWADGWIFPEEPLKSYWTTSLAGSTACFLCGAGASILAPPAIFLTDGPGENPPPIGVTIVSSYYSLTLPFYEKPPALPLYVRILDVVASFVFLPFGVVWFWRGTWMLFDHYFWGFTTEPVDVWYSKLWGVIFAFVCIFLTCEPIFAFFDGCAKNRHVLGLLGRLRTFVLAWGTVSFWRVVWYIWDEFLGTASAWASHAVGIACLTFLGCVSSINAPASTLGVDAVPHENCADEPLFAMIPIPYELVHLFAIGRQPSAGESKVVEKVETDREVELTGSEAPTQSQAGEEKPAEREKSEEGFLEGAKDWASKREVEEGGEEVELPPPASRESKDSFVESPETEGREDVDISATSRPEWSLRASVLPNFSGGNRATFFEMQRPQLSDRRHSECYQRASTTNSRRRSTLFRSR